jgi:hypothetical protein
VHPGDTRRGGDIVNDKYHETVQDGDARIEETDVTHPQRGASPELADLKNEILDLREKLLQFREGDVLSLKERVNALTSRLNLSLAIVGIAAAIFGWFGLKQYRDMNELINKTMSQKIDDSLGYYDRLTRAMLLVNNGGCSSAIPLFRELAENRPDDEVAFMNATYCFMDREEYDQGYEYLSTLRAQGIFPKRFRQLMSYNNSGFLLWVKSLNEPVFEQESLELLRLAEQIGVTEESNDIIYPLYNLTMLHVARGEEEKAAVYAERLRTKNAPGQNWRKAVASQWFRRLETKQPRAKLILEKLLPEEERPSTGGTRPINKN